MMEGSGAGNEVVVDPLQAALAEAESLMQSLGATTSTATSSDPTMAEDFAIDSDDEANADEDDVIEVINEPTDIMLNPRNAGGTSSTITIKSGFVPDPSTVSTTNSISHPLVDIDGSVQRQKQQQQQQQSGTPVSSHPLLSSNSTTTGPLNYSTSEQPHYQQQQQHVPSTMDSMFKAASTSRFASNLANIAQRAATAVNTTVGVATTGPMTTPTNPQQLHPLAASNNYNNPNYTNVYNNNSNDNTMNNNNTINSNTFFTNFQNPMLMGLATTSSTPASTNTMLQQQQQKQQQQALSSPSNRMIHQPQQQQQQFLVQQGQQQKPLNAMSTPSSSTSGTSIQQQHQQQIAKVGVGGAGNISTTPTPTTGTTIELDKEQKNALINQYVGELLTGEHVILFLTNLLHVSDSCNITGSGNSMIYHHQHNQYPQGQNYQQKQQHFGWCCILTYYRILFFNTSDEHERSHFNDEFPCPDYWNKACWPMKKSERIIQIPLACIEKIERSTFTTTTSGAPNMMTMNNNGQGMILAQTPTTTTLTIVGLIIGSKVSGRQIKMAISHNYNETAKVHETLSSYAFPGRRNLGYLFAFECKRDVVMNSIVTDPATGKKTITVSPYENRFDAVLEYKRQLKIDSINDTHQVSRRPWSIWTTPNSMYQLCASYPGVLVGPTSLLVDSNSTNGSPSSNPNISMEALRLVRQCAAFRSENRLPTLSWTSPDGSGGSLWRSSQPKIGLQGNRSTADELFLRHVLECSAAANNSILMQQQQSATSSHHRPSSSSSSFQSIPIVPRQVLVQLTGSLDLSNWVINDRNTCGLKIMDLRPRSSAMANRTGGYGYENTSNYTGTTLQFCNIGNIHTVRDSYQKLCTLCNSHNPSYDLNWTNAVEDTKWLSYIRLILASSWEAAYWVHIYKLPVLVHCSHGWDRTSQVCALAQLLLDPYYRTCAGFACLVEKDFMSFGHPFHMRSGHGEGIGPSGTTVSSNSGSSNSINNNTMSAGSSGGGGNLLMGSSNPLFTTIQQHTGIISSTFAAATGAQMLTSSSSATSPTSGNFTGMGGSGNNNNSSSNNNNNSNSGGPAGQGGSSFDETQISPIFLQFLDCVFQIVELFPEAFEFNTKYLLILSEHIYSCRFGNFLCDTEREREVVAGVRTRTTSVWDYLESRPDTYNKQYQDPNLSSGSSNGSGVLLMPLPVLVRNVRLWTDRHCRCSSKPTVRYVTYQDSESYVNAAILQQKHLTNQEQMPLTTQQENQRILLTTTTTPAAAGTVTSNDSKNSGDNVTDAGAVVSPTTDNNTTTTETTVEKNNEIDKNDAIDKKTDSNSE